MIPKALKDITQADFESLISNQVPEDATIEYKQELWKTHKDLFNPAVPKDVRDKQTLEAKRELAKDVTGPANAHGGDIIVGLSAEHGKPTAIVGVKTSDADDLGNHLLSTVRSKTFPTLVPQIRAVPVQDSSGADAYVFVIRVPQSMHRPHSVLGEDPGHGEFFVRNTTGVHKMSFHELRDGFVLSQTAYDRIQEWWKERDRKIRADEHNVSLHRADIIHLYLIPLGAFSGQIKLSTEQLLQAAKTIVTFNSSLYSYVRPNIDGVLASDGDDQSPEHASYVQLYRNGIIEAVGCDVRQVYKHDFLKNMYGIESGKVQRWHLNGENERNLSKQFRTLLEALRNLDVPLPIFCCVSLSGVRGTWFAASDRPNRMIGSIDRDYFSVPEMVIDSYEARPQEILLPIFEIVWNAAGAERLPENVRSAFN